METNNADLQIEDNKKHKNINKSIKKQEKIFPLNTFLYVFGYIILFLSIFFISLAIVRSFVSCYRYYPVNGKSMQMTINPNPEFCGYDDNGREKWLQDGVFVKLDTPVTYGDIAIIQIPGEKHTVIKRIIAKEGDLISINKENSAQSDGLFHIYIQRAGESQPYKLNEPYLDENIIKLWSSFNSVLEINTNNFRYEESFYNKFLKKNLYQTEESYNQSTVYKNYGENLMKFYRLGEDEIFYLGDNRANSKDSRSVGAAKEDWVVGKVVKLVRDAQTLENEGKLWWVKFKTMLGFLWEGIVEFFAW